MMYDIHRTNRGHGRTCMFIIAMLALAAFAASCASSRSAHIYSRDEARRTQTVSQGVVTQVRPVLIEGTKTPAGTIAGGALGGVAGSAIGSGKGRDLMTVLGAIAGGIAGSAVEEGVTRKSGLEITVNLDSGQTIAVVQEADETFNVGDRVTVLKSDYGTTRIVH
ncbi:MAG: glycine zipper 2TM domain-containing protein [Desulfobacterales bacterium]